MSQKKMRPSDSLSALHEFLLEPEEDVRLVPLEDIKAELKREGVDTSPLIREIQKRLSQARGEAELNQARLKRETLLSRLAGAVSCAAGTARALVQERIQKLGQGQPELAGVYFRKLESTSDADLERLLEDIEALEQLDGEDTPKAP